MRGGMGTGLKLCPGRERDASGHPVSFSSYHRLPEVRLGNFVTVQT